MKRRNFIQLVAGLPFLGLADFTTFAPNTIDVLHLDKKYNLFELNKQMISKAFYMDMFECLSEENSIIKDLPFVNIK